jgi:lipoate-protein ligase A
MTDLADREWRLIREEARPGPMQMALDEVAARTAAEGGPRTVRVYRWQPSTLSLGYRQEPESVDWAFCADRGIDVTRRPTGGGGIYHDAVGDISYTIAVPAGEVPGELLACYELLCAPVLTAFERMGVDAAFAADEQPPVHQPACYLRAIHPAHDILAGGRKISGNAQYRQRDAVVQHGSLSYALAADSHLGVFTADIDAERFHDRITSIREQAGIDRESAVSALEATLGEWADASEGAWTDEELERAADLAERKYESDRWNRDREDPT